MDFQSRFKIFCFKRKIKQKDIAEAIGILPNNLTVKIKKGNVYLHELSMIIKKFNLTNDEILSLVRDDDYL